MVVPYPPGGPTDTIARLVAERMRASLGQPVVIENVSGGGGTIAVTRVARSPGDGYTLSIGHWGSHVINGAVYSLPVDLLIDLEPVALIADGPQLASRRSRCRRQTSPSSPPGSRPIPARAWSAPPASAARRICRDPVREDHRHRIRIVPYRGSAPRMQDLLAGTIHLAFDQASSALAQVQAGKLHGYAVTSKQRLAVAPEIPTVDEAGLPGFYMSVWHGIWARRVRRRMSSPGSMPRWSTRSPIRWSPRLTDLAQELPARERQTPEALAAYQKAEIEKWWPIVKAAGIKVE